MTEVLFYHLEHQPLERVLPSLVEKTLERGWRAVVQAGSEERVEALDMLLWTYREESFLPHGTRRDGNPAAQPVYLTTGEDNPNGAERALPRRRRRDRAISPPTRASSTCSRAATRRRRQGARAVDGGEAGRLRGHLLAAVARRPLGKEGVSQRCITPCVLFPTLRPKVMDGREEECGISGRFRTSSSRAARVAAGG